MKYFNDKRIAIVTKHSKELVLRAHLKSLGMEVIILDHIDTDQLGTFTGDIERKLSAIENAKAKCLLAPREYEFVIASEGSFGPHPWIPGAAINEEYLVILDREKDHYFSHRKIYYQNNFQSDEIATIAELEGFIEGIDFPSHGVILQQKEIIYKGVTQRKELMQKFRSLRRLSKKKILVQSDMRACYNPTRMKNIDDLMKEFKEVLEHSCSSCHAPNFKVVDVREGMRCAMCKLPTKSPAAKLLKCWDCGHEEWEELEGLEDPGKCPWCNP